MCLAGDWLRAVLLARASRGERAHGAGWLAQAEILLSPMISLCFDGRRGADLLKVERELRADLIGRLKPVDDYVDDDIPCYEKYIPDIHSSHLITSSLA